MSWTPRAVAAMLGISPTTLRTWDQRYGLGPSDRTAGGHRRYRDDEVDQLRRMVALTAQGIAPADAARQSRQRVPAAPPPTRPVLTADAARSVRRGFLTAADRLDEPRVRRLADELITAHGVVAAWQAVLAPFLVELGERVHRRGAGVEVEHLASAGLLHALRAVPYPDRDGVLTALLSCAPDEQHTLALEALGAALSEEDCLWRSLGARVPPTALRDALERLRPAVVVIWAHHADFAAAVPIEGLRRDTEAVLVAAGPGWAGLALPASVRRPATLTEAVRLVVDLIRG
ncbi:MerR family transcriptional regulator [Saccharothrix texasensis]|uniref:MerR-like DNA binding protein n=1 Tax=Saccharothrix texasensis TaxID=103734 RepID=A0A3N1H3R4_9PSEU|nr:MerR family transcriptional regulator [Saccharothrix texasensis]ROP37141.1 MerR-like DNA binding protein [Saccharothrix texasensis]